MNLSEIREQLAVIAQRNGRPEYELCVLKAVQFAVNNGTDHPLKEHLTLSQTEEKKVQPIQKPSTKAGPKVPHVTKDQVNELCAWIYGEPGRQMLLAEKAGTSASILWRISKSRTCTKKMFNRLTNAKKAIIKQQEEAPIIQSRNYAIKNGLNYFEGRECKRCQTTTRYVESSRCVHCVKAHYKQTKEMAA
ncbi:hypothetical protein I5730_04940 [Acinetobacter nosocomialis]|uniref:hypothetical protein n=1 Tax=Acinetobacter nosocomialis TaxID=106654 RepID=UPI001901019A|nr:hypothetical protein [Acinetobacter nosocomialis]MBJ9959889.1 hypothetical protein [Acinetobacter nosocomialis]